ncbi:MAG TPA: 2,3,4,5-tetrahydropyridine-2,6-dicarboxylate N-succinyltransferase, partial [Alphaproteobacteria bacterium]|nr:2,3,4,5-tetrahydropyridine-2,6-dicarboxylate N-succinyltransferase [Alphaproteobacteria bacterium]
MDLARLETLIEAAFDDRDNIGVDTQGEVRDAVNATLEALDNGSLRVAEREGVGQWRVNQWAKKAVLLGFRLNDMSVMDGACGGAPGWDKVRLKTDGWGPERL